jgi:alkylated DNA repair dioxygenase AlkB
MMLFGRSQGRGLPGWAEGLLAELDKRLTRKLPGEVHVLLFPADGAARQLIVNLYAPGEGLAAHVDLIHRFADGILLCSLGPHSTGTVMHFTHPSGASHFLFLPARSVLVLSGPARYEWSHGIPARRSDHVRLHPLGASQTHAPVQNIARSIRLSITIRTMLPGADIVGG